jgi:NACalpha-BTF3-like transcription factor
MPYSGIPAGSALEAKIDRCVERVMAQGNDKSAAIGICRASIEKTMNEKDEKQTTNFVSMEGSELPEVESITVSNAGDTVYVDASKMDHGEAVAYDDLMGVMSFAELDAMERAEQNHGKLRKIIDNFMRIARNITRNPGIDPMERSAALRDLTEEMRMRLDADFEMGERTVSLPTINGKLDPVYLQKLSESDAAFDMQSAATNTGFKVLKAKDGTPRWLGWVSNKFMDREGEIITEDAHKDYVAWLDAHPKAAGQLWTFHIPGTNRKNRADFWGYLNGFLLVGGKLTEEEANALKSYDGDLGMSHGFYVLEKQGNLITKYRTFEYTVLPRNAAANPWTKFNVKELSNMSDKGLSQAQRDLAVQLHGEDFVNALESDTNKMATVLSEAGVQSKDDGSIGGGKADGSIGGKEIPADAELVEEVQATEQDVINAVDLAKSVADLVTKQLNPAGLHEAIKTLNESNSANATAIENLTKRLEALELSDDEKMAKELSPKVPGIDWMGGFRASTSKETIVTDKEKEVFKNSKPDESWASSLFNLGGGQ